MILLQKCIEYDYFTNYLLLCYYGKKLIRKHFMKKVVILTGSPRKNGTSNYLAEEFIKGVQQNGYDVYKFDCAKADVKPCLACQACGIGEKPCVHKDDFADLRTHLLEADIIAFVTPIYYFGMTSALKKVIDRFYSIDKLLREKKNKAVLISVQHANVAEVKNALVSNFSSIINWLNIENAGMINAIGIESLEQLKQTEYPKRVYELGKSLDNK